MLKKYTIVILSWFFSFVLFAQNDTAVSNPDTASVSLLNELDIMTTPASNDVGLSIKKIKKQRIYNTFGGTHLINGQTTETIGKKVMAFIISHRFGKMNSGFYELFGLDQASVRFGFEYGILDNLTIGIGRGSFNKTYDGYVKYRFLDQREKGFPLSMAFYTNMAINTVKNRNPNQKIYFSSRLSYCFQLLVSRKFNNWFSMQLMPSVVHQNLVKTEADKNTLFILGAGLKVKLSKRMSFLAEYYARIKDNPNNGYRDAFAFGLDVVTGGHVFQFQFTNAQAMYEQGFMRLTTGNFWKADIHFGFNISRTWGVGKQYKQERQERKMKKKQAKLNESNGDPTDN